MNSPTVKAALAAVILAWGMQSAWADPPPARPVLDAEGLSARIDHLVAARWAEKGVQPAPLAGDAELFRRMSLDLNGRIPSIIDLKDFLDDERPGKRRLWVERLFAKKASEDPFDQGLYVGHFANYWRSFFFDQLMSNNPQRALLPNQLDPWVRKHVKENTPYNEMVRDLLTTPQGQPFFAANEGKAENIASSVARLFLGIKLECAQCHDDRSGGSWTRQQFWELAAFFSGFAPNRPGQPFNQFNNNAVTGKAPRIAIPDSKGSFAEARFLDGTQPEWKTGITAQTYLAEWMTTGDNPYFARAAVNRLWYYFMGTGLVDPVDQMGVEDNPPSHPELLDELAYQFAAHQFDVKYMIRAIVGSSTYQRTSVKTHDSQDDVTLFARMAVRGLSPEQLFDSIQLATGYVDRSPFTPNRNFGFQQPNNPRAEFVARFSSVDRRTERQTSILQALYLMNGRWVSEAIDKGSCLSTIANANVPMTRRIEELYFITLSRRPRADEMERLLRYVENGGPTGDPKKALADVFWALLNSAEFILNH